MIRKSPTGLSPDVEIIVANTPIDYDSINRIELRLEENQHDMVILDLYGIPPRSITDYYYKPVYISISTGANFSQQFYGYVEDVRPASFTGHGLMNDSPFQETRVVCMGTSYNMRGSRSKVWGGYRLSDIAKELSANYRFSVDTPADTAIHDSLLQTNESDWQFITRYAKFLGYSVTLHGTHLHVFDPYKAISRQISYHVLHSLINSRNNIKERPGQIIEFTGTFSKRHIDGEYKESSIPVVQADNSMYDVVSTQSPTANNGVARFPNRVSEYVDNYEEASRRINSVSKEDYDYYADATVLGVAGCKPGGVVSIDKYGGDFDGYWYVQAVTHVVHSDAFYSELKLAKNFNSELGLTNTSPFQEPGKPYYDKDVWVSSRAVANEYS